MRILITGWSGVGKSTICAELQRQGYPAYDGDTVPGLVRWENLATHEPVDVDYTKPIDFKLIGWMWNLTAMTSLLNEHPTIFLCGSATNMTDFMELFDKVVVLTLPRDEQAQRILDRKTDNYGKVPEVLEFTLQAQEKFVDHMSKTDAVFVDANRPIAQIIQSIAVTADNQ